MRTCRINRKRHDVVQEAPVRGVLWSLLPRFARATSGATAIEFAVIAPWLFLTIFFIISIGYMQFMAQALDYATQKAARQLRTGNVQAANVTTQTAFASQFVCPYLPSFFNCSNVFVQAQNLGSLSTITTSSSYPNPYAQFLNAKNSGLIPPTLSNANTFCTGSGSNFVYLAVAYPVPFFMSFLSSSTLATTYNGKPAYVIMSSATFLNEPFSYSGNC